jgi:hypothetical protein
MRKNPVPDRGFLIKNCNLLIPASVKAVHATGEAFSSQKRTSLQTLNFFTVFCFVCHFCPHGSGLALTKRIRIQPTRNNVDLCRSGSGSETLIFTYGNWFVQPSDHFIQMYFCGSKKRRMLRYRQRDGEYK